MFSKLPKEVVSHIFNYLNQNNLNFFSQTSKAMYKITQLDLLKRKQERKAIIYACRVMMISGSDLESYNEGYFKVAARQLECGVGKNFSHLKDAHHYQFSSTDKLSWDIYQITIPRIYLHFLSDQVIINKNYKIGTENINGLYPRMIDGFIENPNFDESVIHDRLTNELAKALTTVTDLEQPNQKCTII